MQDWLESIAGPQYLPAILWTLAALAALVIVLILVRTMRRLSSGTFVAGGRNRKTRLAIMDAAAVDSHRRLVLVRRDDVEHLLLIGGSNDIVVEQNIRLNAPARRPAPAEVPGQPPQRPRPPEAPVPAQRPVLPMSQQPSQQPPRPAAPAQRAPEPVNEIRPAPRPAFPTPPAVAPATPVQVAAKPPAPPAKPRAEDDIDETLLQELEVSLDDDKLKAGKRDVSLEDEMAKLLGELSGPRRPS